jgi:phenylpyruvate tautomerase PptA (4-oxalocrotonate tautomerase family)
VTEVTLDHLRPSPEWKQEGEMLQLVKEAEAAIRRGLRRLAERREREAEQRQLIAQVSEAFQHELADRDSQPEADPF